MKRILKLSLMLMVCANFTQAQVAPGSFGYYQEALLFSRTTPGGTARIQSIGGAQVALGGDISSAYSNPAGLGFFNKSEFIFTPSMNFHNSDTEFLSTKTNTFKNNFNFNNLGIVFKNSSKEGKFKGGAFAISVNRINDFNNEFSYDEFNGNSSIIDSYIFNAEGISPENINNGDELNNAYNTYLINPYPVLDSETMMDTVLWSYDSFVTGFPRQTGTVSTSGSQYRWNFAYGANYDDKLFFGASLGVTTLNYKRNSIFRESEFRNPSNNSFDNSINNLKATEELKINGIGVNATFGLIIRPTDFIRWGMSISTPTFYSLNEESFSDLDVAYDGFYYSDEDTLLNNLSSQGDLFVSNYRLKTPTKLSSGVAFFFQKSGFISFDIDYFDYSNSQLKSDDFVVTSDNRSINNLYKSAINYRVGGEYRFDMFRLRAGYAHQGDPYTDSDIDRSITSISGGLGIRVDDYFVDLAITNTKSDGLYQQYELSDGSAPTANIKNNATNVAVTVGFKF